MSARKSFRHILRSKSFWLMTLCLFVVFLGLLVAVNLYLRSEIRSQILHRDAELIYSVSLLEFSIIKEENGFDLISDDLFQDIVLNAAARTTKLRGVFGVELFSPDGTKIDAIPKSLVSEKLNVETVKQLKGLQPISSFDPHERIDNLFPGAPLLTAALTIPLLEVAVPVHFPDSRELIGIARYWVDGQAVYDEYLKLDRHLVKQFIVLFLGGGCLILIILFWSFYRLFQTNRLLEERSVRLNKANQELTLFAKTSAVGAITAHLIHGLKNPIIGLQEFLAHQRESTQLDDDGADWETANLTIQRMHGFVQELVTVLREEQREDRYDVTSQDIHQVITGKFKEEAEAKRIHMEVSDLPDFTLPNREANCVLLILGNLIKNAIEATPSGKNIFISFHLADHALTIQVEDQGPGLPKDLRDDPFRPYMSSKRDGSGIGLVISHQLARHIQASLRVLHTGDDGTCFGLELPLDDHS